MIAGRRADLPAKQVWGNLGRAAGVVSQVRHLRTSGVLVYSELSYMRFAAAERWALIRYKNHCKTARTRVGHNLMHIYRRPPVATSMPEWTSCMELYPHPSAYALPPPYKCRAVTRAVTTGHTPMHSGLPAERVRTTHGYCWQEPGRNNPSYLCCSDRHGRKAAACYSL